MSVINICKRGDLLGLVEIIDKGGNVCEVDTKGRSCLHFAASMGREDLAQILLNSGSDVMAKDSNGNTPLHYSGHDQVVQLLFDYGAELCARNNHGDTAIDLMQRRGVSTSTIQLLDHLMNDDHDISSDTSTLLSQNRAQNKTAKSQSIFMEFCKDLGAYYLVLLLVVVLMTSLFVAFVVTGYVDKDFSRIPVVDGDTFHKTEL